MDPFLIGGGLGAIGGLLSGITGLFAGNAQAKAYKLAAQEANQQAGVNAQVALQQGNEVAAKAATQTAANGGGFVGSSMGVIQQLSSQAMYNARQQVYRGVTQADSDLYQSKVASDNGINSLIGGVVGGASSLMGGWMQSSMEGQYDSLLKSVRGLGGTPAFDPSMMAYGGVAY